LPEGGSPRTTSLCFRGEHIMPPDRLLRPPVSGEVWQRMKRGPKGVDSPLSATLCNTRPAPHLESYDEELASKPRL